MPDSRGAAQGWGGLVNKKRPPGEGGREPIGDRLPVIWGGRADGGWHRGDAGCPEGWGRPGRSEAMRRRWQRYDGGPPCRAL